MKWKQTFGIYFTSFHHTSNFSSDVKRALLLKFQLNFHHKKKNPWEITHYNFVVKKFIYWHNTNTDNWEVFWCTCAISNKHSRPYIEASLVKPVNKSRDIAHNIVGREHWLSLKFVEQIKWWEGIRLFFISVVRANVEKHAARDCGRYLLLVWCKFSKQACYIYRPQRSCGQGNIFAPVCHSVTGEVCLSACWDTTPPPGTRHPQSRHPPGSGTPPREQTPHPEQTPPEQTPPGTRHSPPGKQTPAYGQWAAGMHPTGMHSCYVFHWKIRSWKMIKTERLSSSKCNGNQCFHAISYFIVHLNENFDLPKAN